MNLRYSQILFNKSGLVWTVCLFLFSSVLFGQSWQLESSKDGINVYLRQSSARPYQDLKIETIMETKLSTLMNVLRDVPEYSAWVYRCSESARLVDAGDLGFYYYLRTESPWPTSDRDIVALSSPAQDPVTKIITVHNQAVDTLRTHVDDVVRLTYTEINWIFEPVDANHVKVTYILQSDPGGDIPAWIINMIIDVGSYNSIKNLQELAKLAKYQHPLSFIQDF